MASISVPSALQLQQWVDQVASLMSPDSVVRSVGFLGEMSQAPVRDLSAMLAGQSGVTFNCPLTKPLTGAGQTDDNTMAGNEEAPVLSNTQGTVHIYKHAVLSPGEYEQAKTNIPFQGYFMDEMGKWAAHRLDYNFFNAALGSLSYDATLNNVAYPSGVVDVGSIGATNLMTVAQIRRVSAMASKKSIRRVNIPGFGKLKGVLLLSPEQIHDLRQDDEYNDIMKNADVRGEKNAIFRIGDFYKGVIDDVLIIEAAATVGMYGVTADTGTLLYSTDHESYRKYEGLFLGASAMAFREYRGMKAIHPDDKDWGNQFGYGASMFHGFVKNVINLGTVAAPVNRDYGLIYVPTAATKLG